jgi:predicted Zn finger-like uncharacterized protein
VYTRCTGCHTTHPVNASLLARAGGKYRCGKCQKTGNALESLFDQWPGAGERPPASGAIPILGLSIDLEQAKKSRLEPEDAALAGTADDAALQPAKKWGRMARYSWIIIAAVLALVVAFEYAEFQEKPLAEQSWARSVMIRLGLRKPPVKQVFQALDQVHLVSRELKSHPFRADTLQLNATIVNRARLSQPYPDLEVMLIDAGGAEVSLTRFKPSDYLAESAADKPNMMPGAFLPFTLDLPDPGQEAVGFELNFR